MSVAGSGATTGLAGIFTLQQVVTGVAVTLASGLALAAVREVQVMCGGVSVAHEIGDVFKKAATGLPRILCRRMSKPAHSVVLLGGLPSSGARIRRARGTARRTLADQPSAPKRIAALPMHPQAAGAHRAGTEFAAAPLGSERIDSSERLTPRQYRLMVQETDQARDDAMEAQNLTESACVRAAAAEAAATRSEQGRREMMERLRHLESVVCGRSRSETPSRQEQGLWPTRRQPRQRGGSDSAPAADTQPPAQESSQERRASGARRKTSGADAEGCTGVLVFVDRLSKMVHLGPVATEATADDSAELILDLVFRHHGLPESIGSDRDPSFTSKTDGRTERVNRVLENALRSFATPFTSWGSFLPMAEFALY
ncbi:hypothetical protein PF008_g3423 [Phytophthora fragariae]|uniref:Integrase catalytic domain-containing protein n=1 Tax=Phytophthora fragariae TaxID=53985 RepID=A0A6G0SG20_9STRA|nr:hypothetical protein PF008_g3423 [Phytophthora fragariae]